MMGDTEIQIILQAIDNVSSTVDSIDAKVNGLSETMDNATTPTQKLSDTWKTSMSSLIALGNAANAVDNIFDSYENLQLRLENASIRVEEALKNERDAQYNLNKVMSDSKSTAEDIAKAKDDLETASNRVTVAQNNEQRANNAVIGTYISMGVQILSLLGSLPTLITSTISLVSSVWASVPALLAQAGGFLSITIAGAPLWAIILAIIAAVTAAILIFKNWDVIVKALGDAFNWLKDEVLQPVWDFFVNFYNWIKDIFLKIIESVIDTIKSAIEFVGKLGGLGGTSNLGNTITNTKKTSVKDAIITPQGIIETDPMDYIIATKNPQSLGAGGGDFYNFEINIEGNVLTERELTDIINENLSDILRTKVLT